NPRPDIDHALAEDRVVRIVQALLRHDRGVYGDTVRSVGLEGKNRLNFSRSICFVTPELTFSKVRRFDDPVPLVSQTTLWRRQRPALAVQANVTGFAPRGNSIFSRTCLSDGLEHQRTHESDKDETAHIRWPRLQVQDQSALRYQGRRKVQIANTKL